MELLEGPLIQQLTTEDRNELRSAAVPARNEVFISSFFCVLAGMALAFLEESLVPLFFIPLGILLWSAYSWFDLITIAIALFRKTKVVGIASFLSIETIKPHRTSQKRHQFTIKLDRQRSIRINSPDVAAILDSLQPNDQIYLELTTIGSILLKAGGYRALNNRKAKARRNLKS